MNDLFHTWYDLKNALILEFSSARDTVDVHRDLEKRKCGLNENIIDEMRRIASEADIMEKDVVKYIISRLNNVNLINSLSVLGINTFSDDYGFMNP